MSAPRRGIRDLVSETAVYGIADAVAKGISFFLFPVYTRILTPGEYGVMEVVGTITFLAAAIFALGLDSATTRYFFAEENRDRQGVVLGSSLMFSVLISVAGTIPLVLWAPSMAARLFDGNQYSLALGLAVAAVPFGLLTNFHLNTYRRLLKPWGFARLSILSLLLTVALNLLFVWYLRRGVEGVYLATLLASSVSAVTGMLLTRRHFTWVWDAKLIRALLRFGVPLVPASLCLWGLALVDRLFLVRFASLEEVGLYSTANRLASVLAFGVAAFQMAWGPFAYSISTAENAKSVYARTLSYYIGWGGLVVLGLSLFAREALGILTPPSYHAAAIAVAPLAMGVLAYGVFTLVAIGVNLTHQTGKVSLTLAGAAGVNLLLCVVLIPPYGMIGAAISTAVGWIAAAIFLSRASQRAYRIPYDWRQVGRIVVLFLVCLAAGLLLVTRQQTGWLTLLVKSMSCVVYLVGLSALGLVPHELGFIRRGRVL